MAAGVVARASTLAPRKPSWMRTRLDARRCISYLTIEYRGVIPRELRSLIGARVFGCDVCQDVCPYNAAADKHPASPDLWPRDAPLALSLPELLALSAAGYRRLVRGSALGRATRRMLQRNAAIALGNSGRPEALEPLLGALALRERTRPRTRGLGPGQTAVREREQGDRARVVGPARPGRLGA